MRNRTLTIAIGAALMAGALPAQAQYAATATYVSHPTAHGVSTHPVSVEVDRPHILKLPRAASAVVVGDPQVADVAVHTTDTLLVLGRSYGTTRLIAMDAAGRVIAEQDIVVGEHTPQTTLRVYQGTEGRESYHCAPRCLAAPSLGDAARFRAVNRPNAPGLNNDVVTAATDPDFAAGDPFGGRINESGFQDGPVLGDDSFQGPSGGYQGPPEDYMEPS